MENFYLQSVRVEKLALLNTKNIKICESVTKPQATKCNLRVFSSMFAEYLKKI